MATMTLRVGSKQGSRSAVIHSERKEMQIVLVSDSLIEEASKLSAEENSSSLHDAVNNLQLASSVEEQLNILKGIVRKFVEANKSINGTTKTSEFCIQLLTELYLRATPKNPLKCSIARMLLAFPEESHSRVASCICANLDKLLATQGCLSEMNYVVSTVNCCFNNFPIGVEAVSHRTLPVLQFIRNSLQLYVRELSQPLSPAKKMEICQMVHNALRTAVSVLQKCQTQVGLLIPNERREEHTSSAPSSFSILTNLFANECKLRADSTLDSERSSCKEDKLTDDFENSSGLRVLNSMLELVKLLMSYGNLPMDTHTNCGFVLVLLVILLRKCDAVSCKVLEDLKVPWDIDLSTDVCQLSIYTGLLNALNTTELCDVHKATGEPVISVIFHELLHICERNNADSGMVFGISRAVLTLSKVAVSTHQPEVIEKILPEMLQFVWIHLEHYMDSVRHSAGDILRNLLELASSQQQTNTTRDHILTAVLDDIVQIPLYKKSRYIGLGLLADVVGCQLLIDSIPNLVEDLLHALADSPVTSHVSSALENLMSKHMSECTKETWINMWIKPILNILSKADPSLCGPVQALLAAAVKNHPDLIPHVLHLSDVSCTSGSQLRTILACLRLARKQGALDSSSELECPADLWKGVLDISILEQAVYHGDVEIRVSALSLLAESHRSTEKFSVIELQLIKSFLVYNINTEIPSLRQQTISLMKKVLSRLRDSSYALHKKIEQYRRKTKEDGSDSVEKLALRSYNTFLLWLLDFCFSNLFPGANFGRRGSSLQILSLCQELIRFDANEPVWTVCPHSVWTHSNANVLLECLKDTFENNKTLASNLLIKFPAEVIGLMEPHHVLMLVEVCLTLSSSHRPPDCITAAYLLRVLVVFEQTIPILETMLLAKEHVTVSYTAYLMIRVLLKRLIAEFDQARQSLLTAASSGPMYGTLFSIRHLLKDVNLKDTIHDQCWCDLITELVNVCFRLNEVVGPVVNSSSPEGHLPMDFQPGKENLDKNSDSTNPRIPVLNVTAQMVLLCSWRTVKEVSLFLGELAEQAPISCAEESKGLLTEKEVFAIGAHLATLLAETKHRGAFEQAYVGFSLLCGRLWRHPSVRLHSLPQLWLQQIMEAITCGKGSKLCATRRSAGLPFMVQALVTTELQVGSKSNCFQQSMTTLLRLADSTITKGDNDYFKSVTSKLESLEICSDEFSILGSLDESREGVSPIEARIHALNILRSLFRNSLLGEMVTPYIAQGVIVAVRGFKGETWAERNSATLLYSALMTRIFGVIRSREALHIRNRMTGRIFFQRYPSLYDFLLEELKEAVEAMEKNNSVLLPALFPVLLLLARLYPSSLEGTDSNLQLGIYAPYVQRCAQSSVLKTRVLAAKALVPLVAHHQHAKLLQALFTIAAKKNISENYRHGILLQISHILGESLSESSVNKEVKDGIEKWILNSRWLLTSDSTCFVTLEIYLHILNAVSKSLFSAVNLDVWHDMYKVLSSNLMQTEELSVNRQVGHRVYLHNTAQLILLLSLTLYNKGILELVRITRILINMLLHSNYEVVNVALIFLENLCNEEEEAISEEEENSTLPVDKYFRSQVQEWNKINYRTLGEQFESDKIAEILLKQQYEFVECRRRTFCVLSRSPKMLLVLGKDTEQFLGQLIQLCQNESEATNWAVLMCAGAVMKITHQNNMQLTSNVASEFVNILVLFSSAHMSTICRIAVAKILLENAPWLKGQLSFFTELDLCKLWTVVITLLDDDDVHVRALASQLVQSLECTQVPVISQRAKELLLEYFFHMMVNVNAVMCAVCFVVWCLQSTDSNSGEELSEERVFDKGEMNIFAEAATLADLICMHLKELVHQKEHCNVLQISLSLEVKLWISQMCWPDLDADIVSRKCNSLADFLKEADNNALFHSSSSHFLLLNHSSRFLTLYRTKKVTVAVQETLSE